MRETWESAYMYVYIYIYIYNRLIHTVQHIAINIFKYSISNYDVPRTHLTHILEKLIHKMERPTKKRAVGF